MAGLYALFSTKKGGLIYWTPARLPELNHFLPYSATQTKYVRLNKKPIKTADQFKILKLYKKEILAFKPDILILSISTVDLHQLRKLCSTK